MELFFPFGDKLVCVTISAATGPECYIYLRKHWQDALGLSSTGLACKHASGPANCMAVWHAIAGMASVAVDFVTLAVDFVTLVSH